MPGAALLHIFPAGGLQSVRATASARFPAVSYCTIYTRCLACPVWGTIGRCSVFKNYLYGYENK